MTLAELYQRLQAQDFGPDDSMIASALMNPRMAAGLAADRFKRGVRTASGLPDEYDNPTPYYGSTPRQQAEAGLGLAGMVQTGAMPMAPVGRGGTLGTILASHGSPHQFDRFDMSKLSSGSGMQSYGHGLYFAEGYDSPVAMKYRKNLSGYSDVLINGEKDNTIQTLAKNTSELKKQLLNDYDGYLQLAEQRKNPENKKTALDMAENIKNKIDLIESGRLSVEPKGYLYNVNLEWPDAAREAIDPLGPQHFLDWYEPTPESILKPLSAKAMEDFGSGMSGGVSGEQDYKTIVDSFRFAGSKDPQNDAIKWFVNQGIPGIKNPVLGKVGKGTSNYVIFDERIPRIMTRNDVSLADLLRK